MASLFQPPAFLSNTNIYEVNIRQYTAEGTFNAFSEHLPRLKEMGVEILWLMPIHPIGKVKRKGTLGSYYSISDHKGVNPEFGSAADLKDLITKAHALGMRVIFDWVANHAAWDHVWTKSNPDFFVKDKTGNFKPPFDWDDVIQIDHANNEQQHAMIAAMQYWLTDFDIDGFRADLAHLTPLQFWKNARLKLTPFKKDLIWLAETEEISYHEAFDISFTWKWMHATEQWYKKEISLKDCVAVLKEYKSDFPPPAKRMFFTSNHDENSWNGTEYEKYGCLAKAFAVFSCMYPGVPLVYSGQELPNMRRLKFFDKDEISWKNENELSELYKKLFALRKKSADLYSEGTVTFLENEISENILAFKLSSGDREIFVLLNMNENKISRNIFLEYIDHKYRNIFSEEILDLRSEYIFSADGGGYIVLEKWFPADIS